MSNLASRDTLPGDLAKWLHFCFGDLRCRCDWTWRRRVCEWELTTYARDCPHHKHVYGEAS